MCGGQISVLRTFSERKNIMENIVNKKIDKYTSNYTEAYDKLVNKNIEKADYDKTLIGFVSEKIERDDGSYRWRIQTSGTAYDIKPEMCNIKSVGQRVRLYIPNHNYYNKYAEVLTDDANTHPNNIVYGDGTPTEITENDDKHTLTQDTITETWENVDGTSYQTQYTIIVKDKGTVDENVEKMIFPDGSEMELEGFNTFFGGGI